MADRHGLDPGERGLRRDLGRTDEARQPAAPRGLGGDEDARRWAARDRRARARRPRRARRAARRGIWRDAARTASAIGRSNPEPSLRRPAGARLTVMPPQRPLELGARDPAADALLRLLARLVGKPDDREARDAALEVRLDLDRPRVEADQGMGDRAREHSPRLRGESARVSHGLVAKAARDCAGWPTRDRLAIRARRVTLPGCRPRRSEGSD